MSATADSIVWLTFVPRTAGCHGAQTERVGAHAFRADAPYSLCGCTTRSRSGGPADTEARHCSTCERVAAGHAVADLSYTGRPGVMRPAAPIDSRKPHIPGTDPLDPLPFTAAERDELIRRVRALTAIAATAGGEGKRGTKIAPRRLAALRAEREAAREQARAHARSLAGGAR